MFNATNLQILQFFFHVTLLFYYFNTTKFPIALLTAGQQEERGEGIYGVLSEKKIIRLIYDERKRKKDK